MNFHVFADLVPGIILLKAEEFIPVDARLIRSVTLKSEGFALTGEPVPSKKDAEAIAVAKVPPGDRCNMVLQYYSWYATAVVKATGMRPPQIQRESPRRLLFRRQR